MRETLSMTNQRLLSLYNIPIETTNNETAEMFINQEVEIRIQKKIKKAKDAIFKRH